MGIEIRGVPEAAPLSAEETHDRSIGRYLAQQRKLRRISVEELAELTKIPRRSLERLEAGAFDSEPDGFVRGFVRTVAGALGLDPNEAVMRLLREPLDDDVPAMRSLPSLRAVTAALLALLGIAVIGVTLWGVVGMFSASSPAPVPADDVEIVYRHDAVRALAREQRERAAAIPGEAARVDAGKAPKTPPLHEVRDADTSLAVSRATP